MSSPAKAPLRRYPRIATDAEAVIQRRAQGTASTTRDPNKLPIHRSAVINVSQGGAQLVSTLKPAEGDIIHVELSEPIFTPATLIPSRVAHCTDAPPELAERLHLPGKKNRAYLLGVAFEHLEDDQRATLEAFIKQRLGEERTVRGDQHPTARDRVATLKPAVPTWAYGLGLVVAAFMALRGLLQGQADTDIAIRIILALVGAWVLGRVASRIWITLEVWRAPPETEASAPTPVSPNLADADTNLTVVEEPSDPGTPLTPLPSPTEGVSAGQVRAA